MRALSLLTLLAVFGCSHGNIQFNQGKLRSKLDGPVQVNDESIRQKMEARPQLTTGFRLAIHIADPDLRWGSQPWSSKDRARIMQMVQASCGPKFCKDIVEIPALDGDGDKLYLRQAAAERGAHAVLWIRGVQDVQVTSNGRAWTNVLILPAFFIESEDIHSYFLVNAQWIDVANGYMYADLQTVGRAKAKQAPTQNESKEILKVARSQALDQLLPMLDKTFQNAMPAKK